MPTTIQDLRPDWEIAKQIAHHGSLEAARAWMRRPLVDLRGLTTGEGGSIEPPRIVELIKHPMFNDANYIFETHSKTCVLHVAYFYSRTPRPVVYATFWMPFNTWAPVVTLGHYLDDGSLASVWDHSQIAGEEQAKTLGEQMRERWLMLLDRLAQSSFYPVKVQRKQGEISPKQRRNAAKTRELKPWLNPRAPRVIMLNPTERYPEHGRGGTHASPMPHQRRGHWRTLQAERYGDRRGQRVWVKPAWIGSVEWSHKGNVYRVIEQAS